MIDLHTHSLVSDGSDSPSHLVRLAGEAGCQAIALTDHDTVGGIEEAQFEADRLGIELIPGIELSCHTSTRNVHILGYFLDPTDSQLDEHLAGQRAMRDERNARLAERLTEIGLALSMEEVTEVAGGESVGRPHFAAVMMKRGYVSSIDEAFMRFLSDDGPAFVARKELPASEGIAWIHAAGGVASWAHPERHGIGAGVSIESVVEELVGDGLDAMETLYSRYDPVQRDRLTRLARRNGLVPTGGSDYHGSYKPDLSVGTGTGDLSISIEILEELREQIPHSAADN